MQINNYTPKKTCLKKPISTEVQNFINSIENEMNLGTLFLTKLSEFAKIENPSNPAVAEELKMLKAVVLKNADHFSDQEKAREVANQINAAAESIFFPKELINHIMGFQDPATYVRMKYVSKEMEQLAIKKITCGMNKRHLPIKDFGFNTIDKVIEFTNKNGQNIEYLDLKGYDNLNDEQFQKIITNCPNLKHLAIYKGIITNAALADLTKKLPALHTLRLHMCEEITDEGVAHLEGLKDLRTLVLAGCDKITDEGVAHLEKLTALQTLCLSACNEITDEGVAHLRKLTALQTLDLSACNKITADGLVHLTNLKELQALLIGWCDINEHELNEREELNTLLLIIHGFISGL